MDFGFKPGMSFTKELIVSEEYVTRHLGEDLPLFATPAMINWMELSCVDFMRETLPEGFDSVGAGIGVSHSAATPLGMKVTLKAEITDVNGALLDFKLEAWDEECKISEGTHKRAVIEFEKFRKKVLKKAGKL